MVGQALKPNLISRRSSVDQNIPTPIPTISWATVWLLGWCKNWWSGKNEGAEFANVTPVQPSKTNIFVQQFHFRSNAVKAIQTYKRKCWEKWITSNSVKIPAYQIENFKINGDPDYLNYMILNTLKFHLKTNINKLEKYASTLWILKSDHN